MDIKKLNILHISDVHFHQEESSHAQGLITRALVDAIQTYENKIDYCIFTGDLANRASNAEYTLAENWLLEIYAAIDNKNAKMLICPGNHDVDRNSTSLSHFRGAATNNETFRDFLKSRTTYQHLDNFLLWHDNFKNQNNWVISDWTKDVNLIVEECNNVKINFIIANSAILSCDNSDQGYLCVNIDETNSCLLECRKNNGINIFSMHHPLDGKWFIPWNENELTTALSQKFGCHMLLSGHVHNADAVSSSNNNGQNIAKFECGSAYTGGRWKKEFSILEIDLNSSKVTPHNYVYADKSGEWFQNNAQSRPVPIDLSSIDLSIIDESKKKS